MVARRPGDSPQPFLDSVTVNRFAGSFYPAPVGTETLRQALEKIRSDFYRQEIEQLRLTLSTKGKGLYDSLKRLLPAYTFAGTFSPTRAKHCLQVHSGIVGLDFDGVNVDQARGVLCAIVSTSYVFVSPSGSGIKAGVRVTPVTCDSEYKLAWQAIADHIQARYNLKADSSGKDVCRLCYASFDPWCYVNEAPSVFHVPPLAPVEVRHTPASTSQARPCGADRRQHYVQLAIDRAVKLIESSCPAMPGSPGTRHHNRLKAARLLGGYIGGGLLTYDHAYHVLETAVRANTIHLAQSMRTIDAGLRYGMKSPVTIDQLEQERQRWCQAHGYAFVSDMNGTATMGGN